MTLTSSLAAWLHRSLPLSAPRVARTDRGRWRVSWTAGRDEVWFESDHELAPSAEAAVAAFLLPRMKRGGGLAVAAPLDPSFVRGLETVRAIAREILHFRGGRVDHEGLTPAPGGRGTSLFFTGGVDSFHALRRNLGRVNRLIYVEGFDVDLDDEPRLARVRKLVVSVAGTLGLGVVVVRTNLRRVSSFSRLTWVATHPSALAAVGHLLRCHHDTVLFGSAGVTLQRNVRWAQVVPALSSSSLTVATDGVGTARQDKVLELVDWSLVRDHLRVCWLNDAPTLNCGVCEKCLRTRLAFIAAGCDAGLPTMPPSPLVPAIDALSPVRASVALAWSEVIPSLPPGPLRAAAEAYVVRCRLLPPDTGLRRLARKTRRLVARLLGRPAVSCEP